MTPSRDLSREPQQGQMQAPGQPGTLDLSHQREDQPITLDPMTRAVEHFRTYLMENPVQECALLSEALKKTGADLSGPCAAMLVEQVAAGLIAELQANQAELVAALKDAIGGISYLAPEKFDDDEHEANFNRGLEEKRALVEKFSVPSQPKA